MWKGPNLDPIFLSPSCGTYPAQVCDEVKEVLRSLGAKRIVVGHTIQEGGRFRARKFNKQALFKLCKTRRCC
jgi:hypothetical protein